MSAVLAPLTPAAGDWWQLPSGRIVSVRSIDGSEATVRYIDAHGAMATGEFHLTVPFIALGKKVGHDG